MAILDNLVEHWRLNEAANVTRVGSSGSHNLTDKASNVGSAAGKLGNAAVFDATVGKSLRLTPASAFAFSGDFTIMCGVNMTSVASLQVLVSKNNNTDNGREYHLFFNNSQNRFGFRVFDGTGEPQTNGTTVFADDLGAPSTGTWYLIFAWYTGGNIYIQVDDGTPDSGALAAGPFEGNAPLNLGQFEDNIWNLDGMLDNVAIWGRAISACEREELYNSGSWLDYSFTGVDAVCSPGSAALTAAAEGSLKGGGESRIWTPPGIYLP
jgi:hypothetical protein